MMSRCYNANFLPDYRDWGGRGITVCDEWHDFFVFVQDMAGKKPTPEHQIDRIDNDKGYSPDNCRWVTRLVNARNTRRSRWITANGTKRCLTEWAEFLGVKPHILYYRLDVKGMSIEQVAASIGVTL
jgi:hypothetical protein